MVSKSSEAPTFILKPIGDETFKKSSEREASMKLSHDKQALTKKNSSVSTVDCGEYISINC